MGVSLEGIEKEKAEKRQKATQFKPGYKPVQRTRLPDRPSSREEDRQQPQKHHRGSSYEIAKRIGVSHATNKRR